MSSELKSAGRSAGERIQNTAAKLFYQRGIRAVGVDELVNRAGATKPSLYRNFDSKDDLVAAYLRDFAAGFWQRFDAAVDAHAGNPRAQLRELFDRAARRMRQRRYRGCALTNAAVEYPEPGHPARTVVQRAKLEVRRRLTGMARALDISDPKLLADGLMMLLEGAYVSRQLFGDNGPSTALVQVAERLIDDWPRPSKAPRNTSRRSRRGSRRG
jgi:AcrR family transcriptional regulator